MARMGKVFRFRHTRIPFEKFWPICLSCFRPASISSFNAEKECFATRPCLTKAILRNEVGIYRTGWQNRLVVGGGIVYECHASPTLANRLRAVEIVESKGGRLFPGNPEPSHPISGDATGSFRCAVVL